MSDVSEVEGIVIPTRTIMLPGGGSIEVRGLSLNDLSHLAAKHWEDLATLIQALSSPDVAAREKAIRTALTYGSGLASEAVAMAADNPALAEAWDKVPAAVQLETFAAVVELTIVDDLHLSLALEALTDVVETASRAGRMIQEKSSPTGSSLSAGTAPSSAKEA